MRAYRLFFEPDRAVPQFRRLRFEEVDVPLRDVLTRGCHPAGACCRRGEGRRDSSNVAEAVVAKLNEDDARVAALKDFGYSHDLHTTCPPSRYAYGGSWQYRDPSLAEELRALGKELYFVRDLSFRELFVVAWERLKAGWNGAVARSMLTKRFHEFNELRRFLKSKNASITLHKRDEVEALDLGGVLGPEDFRDQEKLVVEHGIPDPITFRRESALGAITTDDGILSLAKGVEHFELAVESLTWNCERRGDRVRAVPDMPHGNERLREKARGVAARFGESRYCFTATIEDVERLVGESGETAKITFPMVDYAHDARDRPESSAGVTGEVTVPRFNVPAAFTDARTGDEMRAALAWHGEKVSGTKDELVERLAALCAELLRKHEDGLRRYFRGRYVRLNPGASVSGQTFQPRLEPRAKGGSGLTDTPLAATVVTMFVMRHLRADRIFDAAHENTTYTCEDLARAILKRQVALSGAFVHAQ